MFENAYAAEWINSPGMMGERWAKEQLDKATAMLTKYVKTDEQKRLAEIAFKDSDNWHYWCNNVSNKDIAMVRYILRRIDAAMVDPEKMFALFLNIKKKHAMWRSDFSRYLDVRCYQVCKERYRRWYFAGMRFYGLTFDAAVERLENYITDAAKRVNL